MDPATTTKDNTPMMRLTLTLALLLTAAPALAQINPYTIPPGWVIIQPCGQEPGVVPGDHPAAHDPAFQCPPPIPAPDPAQPWTLAPSEPMELGHAYQDPYGLIIFVTRIESRLVWDEPSAQYRVQWSGDGLQYQSEWMWRVDQLGRLVSFDPGARGVRWEVTR